ncbi:MAG: pyruvate kinase [Meiothermus sp.]|uniref:pyruvate kinase n=1 Tax=Meiothermus sp. TaxID=1955249 RepID=UPI0025E33073|nr:pyruvate kinase [Meiothermus sp.]MCS7069646.1 pyruvate kinase [Meiothermus sp.]MDW8426480.1 pyruvate kinase [Meiothermus sp.]
MQRSNERAHLEHLYQRISALRAQVEQEGAAQYRRWQPYLKRPFFARSARNLADYLVLRKHDLRPLQRELARLGLSSLGRAESRVRENLDAVLATLGRVLGLEELPYPTPEDFFAREAQLEAATEELFGPGAGPRILVTLPEEVAADPTLASGLVAAGMDAARINCGHGDPVIWGAMIAQVRQAAQAQPIPILMDLSGPRLRIERVQAERRLFVGDPLLLITQPAFDEPCPFQATVGLPEALSGLQLGHRVFLDEGKLEARVERVEPQAVLLRVVSTPPKGFKLQPEKGLNLPDTPLAIGPLSAKDLQDLEFALQNADLLGYSFVQRPEDVERLLLELEARRPSRLRGLVLKIETRQAVSNLPELMVRAAGRWPTAIMIARGDLAVELGYERLAEMQEEILWLAEAASVPVIWATQVLDRLVRKGTPSRAEVSDAVLAARAECVMLNKGPYLEQGIRVLSEVLRRMQDHQYKKTPKMRPLKAWAKSAW